MKNYMESTRYGLKGSAKISGFWSAGFRIEAESKEAASQQLNEFNDDNSNNASGPNGGAAVFRRDFDEVAGSAAIKHKPTGLFAMGVFSISDSDDSNVFGGCNGQDAPTMMAWNVQAGAGWTSCRSISLARRLCGAAIPTSRMVLRREAAACQALLCPGGSASCPNVVFRHCCQHDPSGKYVPSMPFATQVTGSDVNDWFIALEQNFEAAAFHSMLCISTSTIPRSA